MTAIFYLCFDAQFMRGYEQMVSNAAKKVSDPLAEIVLDARSLVRYNCHSLPSVAVITIRLQVHRLRT
jgi:hypothetical protein